MFMFSKYVIEYVMYVIVCNYVKHEGNNILVCILVSMKHSKYWMSKWNKDNLNFNLNLSKGGGNRREEGKYTGHTRPGIICNSLFQIQRHCRTGHLPFLNIFSIKKNAVFLHILLNEFYLG